MIRMTYLTNTWVFSNPRLENEYVYERPITFGRSASGQLYRYLKGPEIKSITLDFEYMTDTEKQNAQLAFSTINTNDFTYIDHNNVSKNARFLMPKIDFKEMWDEVQCRQDFVAGDSSVISTLRKNPRWSFQVALEVWDS